MKAKGYHALVSVAVLSGIAVVTAPMAGGLGISVPFVVGFSTLIGSLGVLSVLTVRHTRHKQHMDKIQLQKAIYFSQKDRDWRSKQEEFSESHYMHALEKSEQACQSADSISADPCSVSKEQPVKAQRVYKLISARTERD